MTNLARFTINGTPSSQGGYDIDPGDTLTFALEASSSLVGRVTIDTPRRTTGAPAFTLSNGTTTGSAVDAATPSASVTVSAGIPAARAPHLWEIRCRVNGGTNSDGSVNPDFVFSRFIAMRNANGRRKIMAFERGEYDPAEAWASAVNELMDEPLIENPNGIIPISVFVRATGWSTSWATPLMLLRQSVTGTSHTQGEITHLLRHGTIITGSLMAITPDTHAALPATVPILRLQTCPVADNTIAPTMTDVLVATDASADVAAYNVAHAVTATGASHHVDLNANRYFLTVEGEAGANTIVGLSVSRVALTIVNP